MLFLNRLAVIDQRIYVAVAHFYLYNQSRPRALLENLVRFGGRIEERRVDVGIHVAIDVNCYEPLIFEEVDQDAVEIYCAVRF